MNSIEIQKLSDSQLYKKCKEYGGNARMWLRKFAGLLPEVERRKLYKKKGYSSIYEFAAKLAGMSHETVDRILRLDKRLEDKPILREKLTSGSASWTKLEKVSYIATAETEQEWAEKIDTLTKSALEAYVKEVKKGNGGTVANIADGSNVVDGTNASSGSNRVKSVPGNTFLPANSIALSSTPTSQFPPSPSLQSSGKTFSFKINSNLELRLRLLKQKLEKERKGTLTFQEVFEELVNSYEEKQEITKRAKMRNVKVVQVCPDCAKRKQLEKETQEPPTRRIPAAIQAIIDNRSKSMCEFPYCIKPKEIYHHTKRFSLAKTHDPDFIVALCKSHERLAHAGLIENEETEPSHWKIRPQPETGGDKFFIDKFVQRYRREALPQATK